MITFPFSLALDHAASRSRILRTLTADILDVRQLIPFEHLTEKFNLLTNHFYVYLVLQIQHSGYALLEVISECFCGNSLLQRLYLLMLTQIVSLQVINEVSQYPKN